MTAIATPPAARHGVARDTLPLTAVTGAVVGTVFVELSAFRLPLGLAVVLAALGGVGLLVVGGLAAHAQRRPLAQVELAAADRRFQLVLAVEVLALAVGIPLLTAVFDTSSAVLPWIAGVTGFHLVALGRVWRSLRLELLGAAVGACAIAGFGSVFSDGPGVTSAVVAGVVPGFLLLVVSGLAVPLRRSQSSRSA